MKVTTIKCEHTRQVRNFEPVRFEITAQIEEGEDPIKAAKELQRLVLMVTYKDKKIERDMLIKQLVDTDTLPEKEAIKYTSNPKTGQVEEESDFI